MTTHHDPERGHFVIDWGDGFEMTGVDLGRTIVLSNSPGRQQLPWMTPEQARELAAALTAWADDTDSRPPLAHHTEPTPAPLVGAEELPLFDH